MPIDRVRSRLTDMLVAMDRIDGVVAPLDFDAYQANFEKQWLVERESRLSRKPPDMFLKQ